MIQVFINNQEAVPSLTSTIKLTRQNQFLKEVEGFTYDITFPMCHAANRRIMGNLQRMDVRKTGITFDSVRLVADNVEIISGTGTVTSVTQDEVKLQIKTATATTGSRRYPNVFYEHFTTEIVLLRGWVPDTIASGAEFDGGTFSWGRFDKIEISRGKYLSDLYPDISDLSGCPVLGTVGKCVYPVVYSSTGDAFYNVPGMYREVTGVSHYTATDSSPVLFNILPCFNLLYVVKYAIEKLAGYTADGEIFTDELATKIYFTKPYDPAGRLVDLTPRAGDALPRWSLATMLEHLRNLFNLQYTINPTAKTIAFNSASTSATTVADAQAFEPLDEFSTDYDEDGVAYLSATNVAYDIENSNDSRYFHVLTDDLRSSFPIKECASVAAIKAAVTDAKARLRTIFHTPTGYYYYHTDDDGNVQLRRCAFFTPIIRDEGSDSETALSFVPAGWSEQLVPQYHYFLYGWNNTRAQYALRLRTGVLTLTDNYSEAATTATVQSVMEGDADAPAAVEESTEAVSIFLLGEAAATVTPTQTGYVAGSTTYPSASLPVDFDLAHYYMTGYAYVDGPLLTEGTYAAPPFSSAALAEMAKNSLALTSTPATNYIGRYHEAIAGKAGSETLALVDTHTKVCIKFRSDTIPEATKPFIFNGKKYICEKIEVEIKDGAVQPVKTGYFYEVTPGT